MIRVSDLYAYYGHVPALKGINLEVKKGEIVSVLGPNGAGKTTLLRAISGLKPPKIEGKIFLNGMDITGLSPEEIRRRGLVCLIEGKRVFPGLTVKDNLILGAYIIRKDKGKIKENMELVFEMFPVLKEKLEQKAGLLSGGEQQMLAISRALMGSPSVICLDEPSLGLAPQVVEKIFTVIKELNSSKKITFIVVEQDAMLALKYSSRALLLTAGRIGIEGSSSELMKDNLLVNIYLGGYHR